MFSSKKLHMIYMNARRENCKELKNVNIKNLKQVNFTTEFYSLLCSVLLDSPIENLVKEKNESQSIYF